MRYWYYASRLVEVFLFVRIAYGVSPDENHPLEGWGSEKIRWETAGQYAAHLMDMTLLQ